MYIGRWFFGISANHHNKTPSEKEWGRYIFPFLACSKWGQSYDNGPHSITLSYGWWFYEWFLIIGRSLTKPPKDESWTCKACGAYHYANFDQCQNCWLKR